MSKKWVLLAGALILFGLSLVSLLSWKPEALTPFRFVLSLVFPMALLFLSDSVGVGIAYITMMFAEILLPDKLHGLYSSIMGVTTLVLLIFLVIVIIGVLMGIADDE